MPRGQARRVQHTKSRLGCRRCKERKVKCDEMRPICGNCQKYGDSCHFPTPLPTPNSSLAPPSPMSDIQNLSALSPRFSALGVDERSSRRKEHLLELRLMHHYTYSTSQEPLIYNHDPSCKDIYTCLIPILALEHECLLNAVFATAALHIFKIDPSKREFDEAHRHYFEAAVSSQRQAVDSMTAYNADAICLTASMIIFQALTMRTPTQTYEPPTVWLDLGTGNEGLFRAAMPFLVESNRILATIEAAPNLRAFKLHCYHTYPDIFPSHLDEFFPRLLDFDDPSEILDERTSSVYKFVMGFVAYSLEHIEENEDTCWTRRRLTAFGSMVPLHFKTFVRERRPRALVLLAYYFAVLKAVDNVWWIRGVPEREVFGLQAIIPERWQWAMVWPIQKIALYAASGLP